MNYGFKKLFWKVFSLDVWLLLGLLAISGYGLLVLYSASGGSEKMFTNRVVQVALGLGVLFFMAMLPPRWYKKKRITKNKRSYLVVFLQKKKLR